MMETCRSLLLILSFVLTVQSDSHETDGIHLDDLIKQLQGRPYLSYHRVGNDRTYYYHSGPNDDRGTVVSGSGGGYSGNPYYGSSGYYQPPSREGYRSMYVNGQWRTTYQTECNGRVYDYIGSTPRFFCDCGASGQSYQLGSCTPNGK